jgi:AcrR family transcriptional regulator
MRALTVDWTGSRAPGPAATDGEGLRERKKRQMRQMLSDTATAMFVARGFDAVRVSEVAAVCGVSEKTVYNYFSTKESLVLDRADATMASLRSGLADSDVPPVRATLRVLADELRALTSWMTAQPDASEARAVVQQFGALITASSALRAHNHEMTDNLVVAVTEILAERAHVNPSDPEPQIAAIALVGLWQVQFNSLKKYLGGRYSFKRIEKAVTAEVERAARLVETGLSSLERAAAPLSASSPTAVASDARP